MTIAELETYFDQAELPDEPVKINNFATIVDSRLFVNAQLSYLRKDPLTYQKTSAYLRLIEFKTWLESRK